MRVLGLKVNNDNGNEATKGALVTRNYGWGEGEDLGNVSNNKNNSTRENHANAWLVVPISSSNLSVSASSFSFSLAGDFGLTVNSSCYSSISLVSDTFIVGIILKELVF